MSPFEMCPVCRKEYSDVHDRRFHAQPVACNNCGPFYSVAGGEDLNPDQVGIVVLAAEEVNKGGIIAVKGLGGFHLICDAGNEPAVQKLRLK